MSNQGLLLKNFIRNSGITQEEAANKLGMSRQNLSIYLGKDELSSDFLQKVKTSLQFDITDVNGDKLDRPIKVHSKYHRPLEGDAVKFYDVDFEAGKGVEFYDDIHNIEPLYTVDLPDFRGCTAFRTYNSSMENVIRPGAWLFSTLEDDWKEFLEFGQIHGIVLNNRRRLLKQVLKHQDNTKWLLRSYNPDFGDIELPTRMIKSVWFVHGWVNRTT